jgi:hypothetical protein
MQNAWTRFDQLSNLQTASFLLGLLVALTGAAVSLIIVSASLAPAPRVVQPEPAAVVEAPVRIAARVERSEPVVQRAVTLPATVHLRAEPTTSAQSLAVLPRDTELELLDDASAEYALWRNVRTTDGREGWIIATALE